MITLMSFVSPKSEMAVRAIRLCLAGRGCPAKRVLSGADVSQKTGERETGEGSVNHFLPKIDEEPGLRVAIADVLFAH